MKPMQARRAVNIETLCGAMDVIQLIIAIRPCLRCCLQQDFVLLRAVMPLTVSMDPTGVVRGFG
jgi:hypothetical protein